MAEDDEYELEKLRAEIQQEKQMKLENLFQNTWNPILKSICLRT